MGREPEAILDPIQTGMATNLLKISCLTKFMLLFSANLHYYMPPFQRSLVYGSGHALKRGKCIVRYALRDLK